jgi:hypothetical protein
MEPGGSSPHSKMPATCPYHEPARSNPYPHAPLLWKQHTNCDQQLSEYNLIPDLADIHRVVPETKKARSQSITHRHIKGENCPALYLNIQSVPRSRHILSLVLKTSQLMLYRETATVWDSYKVINTPRRQKEEFLNAKPGGVQSNLWGLKGLIVKRIHPMCKTSLPPGMPHSYTHVVIHYIPLQKFSDGMTRAKRKEIKQSSQLCDHAGHTPRASVVRTIKRKKWKGR